MRNTKSAFTLVELIVVITILAILGTIAFISLQGYSADARNSKRISDLGNIQSAMTLKQVEGTPLMSFVTSDTNNRIASISIAGANAVAGTDYEAGTPTYSVLNVAAKDFQDPMGDDYRIGVTTKKGGAFEIAASMETEGANEAMVNGSYVARTNAAKTPSAISGQKLTMAASEANFFKVNDTVVDGSGNTNTVSSVGRDGVTVRLANTFTGSTIALNANESDGLIGEAGAATGVVTHQGTVLPY